MARPLSFVLCQYSCWAVNQVAAARGLVKSLRSLFPPLNGFRGRRAPTSLPDRNRCVFGLYGLRNDPYWPIRVIHGAALAAEKTGPSRLAARNNKHN